MVVDGKLGRFYRLIFLFNPIQLGNFTRTKIPRYLLTKLKIKEEVYTYKKTSFNSLSSLSLKSRKITKNKLLFLFNMYHFIDRFKGEEEEKNGLDSFNIK
jgi:hypothetical protein